MNLNREWRLMKVSERLLYSEVNLLVLVELDKSMQAIQVRSNEYKVNPEGARY